jgi:hypothetical protein
MAFLGVAAATLAGHLATPGAWAQGAAPAIPIPADPEALRDFAIRQAARVTELERLTVGIAPPSPLVVGGFILFIAVVAFGLGRYAWQLRRDFVTLLTTAPRDPGIQAVDRLELFRDAPAGMPEGTIRAVIAIAIVLVALPAMVFAKVLGLTSTGEFGTIIGGVLGFYFGTRTGGGDAEAARRQADFSLREAQSARQAKEEAERTTVAAEAAKEQAQAEAGRATEIAAQVASTAEARARETGEAASRIAELAARAAEGVAVARAIAGLLPAGPAATAVMAATGTAGAVLAEASRATSAIQGALANPTSDSVTAAVNAASAVLRSAGEGTEVAARLQGALDVVRDATSAIGAVRAAVDSPTAESIAAALAQAGQVAAGRLDGGLGGALAPALGVLGSVMKLPGLAGVLGAATPVGLAGGLVLGAWQAAQLGRQHYARWMARVLDRPVSRDLFPGGEWDGEAARILIAEVPALARALAAEVGPAAPQEAAAGALARLLDAGAGAWLWEAHRDAFASEAEAEAAVAALRRRVLEAELDRVDQAPVPLGGGIAVPQARLREDLDRLREAGAGEAIDTLALLADGVINARPEVPGGVAPAPGALDVPGLLTRALQAAAPAGQAMERAPAPPAPVAEGA